VDLKKVRPAREQFITELA